MSNEDPSVPERLRQHLSWAVVARTLQAGWSRVRSNVTGRAAALRQLRATGLSWLQWSLVTVFGVLVGVRLLPFRDVVRDGSVVISGNDPYRIRYWVEQLSADYGGIFDLSILPTLPTDVATIDPLTVLTLWWLTELFGGGATAAGWVLAFYPVVSAVVTAWIVYRLATRLATDPRVGVAAVGLLAVAPGHAFRTGFGFADHHAFDYPWLALTVFAVVAIVDAEPLAERRWHLAGLLGLAVTGQTLAWQASPLLLAPFALAVGLYGLVAVRAGRTGVARLATLAAGLAPAALTTAVVHVAFGWPVSAVAATPGLLFAGTLGVTLVAAVVVAADRSSPTLVGLYAVAAGGSLLIVRQVRSLAPALTAELLSYVERGVSYFASFQSSAFGEAQPLTAQFGPVAGPLIMLGYSVFLGLPVTLWAVWRAYDRNEAGWLLVSVYVWYFAAASLLQRRFTGELAPLVAVPAGLGLLVLLAKLDLVRPVALFRSETGSEPTTDSETEGLPSGSRRAVVVGAISFVIGFFPVLFTWFIHDDLTIEDPMYDAATWMRAYADDRGWVYPENYVFSRWGRNRVYNYYVSGESRSYLFAQREFSAFLTSPASESAAWYDRLRDRTGFVVTRDGMRETASITIYSALHGQFGSGGGGPEALEHYRAVYTTAEGRIKVFTLVPGATLTGTASPETSFTLATDVEIPGAAFRYTRELQTDSEGRFEVTVPQPGEYTLGGTTVRVPEEAVTEGGKIEVGSVGTE